MSIELINIEGKIEFPKGITLSTLKEKDNLAELVEFVEICFKDHWGHVERPFEEILEMWERGLKNSSFFDTSKFFIAYSNKKIVGLTLCMMGTAADCDAAYIQSVCVRKEYRKKGIAKALLLHSFDELRKSKKTKASLEVDSTSPTGANGVYQGVGMKPEKVIVCLNKVIREGEISATE